MTRLSSPELIGRSVELSRLRAAAEAGPATRCVVLVSGEAGIGKSRLLDEWAAEATQGSAVVLRAACIDAGVGLAHVPILDLLEQLTTVVGIDTDDLRDAFGGSIPSSTARDVDGQAVGAGDPGRDLRLRELRDRLIDGAGDGRLIAIVDDVHWIDRSSLDVLAFLARRLSGSGVILGLAYRSDEIVRRHPLRPFITDVERNAVIDHIRLEPLTPDDVARQVAAILEGRSLARNLDGIVERADGNPFHVEELVALDVDGPMPRSLGDVLRLRLDRLGDAGRAVISQAAAIGREFDVRLLEASSLDAASLVRDGLHQAIEAAILVSAEDQQKIRFRHALIREAAYDDLLATERIDVHRRIAVALVDHPELGEQSPVVAAAERARQWAAALDMAQAFSAWVEVGRAAGAAGAWHEAVAAWDHVLGLWERDPEPVARSGGPRSKVIRSAARASWLSGDTRRAIALSRMARAEPDVASDPWVSGDLLEKESWFHDELGEVEFSRERADQARAVVPSSPATALLALVVATQGTMALRDGLATAAVGLLQESVDICMQAGALEDLPGHRAWLAYALATSGDSSAALEVAEALLRYHEATNPVSMAEESLFAHWTVTPTVILATGQYERSFNLTNQFRAKARDLGLDAGVDGWLCAQAAFACLTMGRWDEALRLADEAAAFPPHHAPHVILHTVRAIVHAGRGDGVAARAARSIVDELVGETGAIDHAAMATLAGLWADMIAGNPADAVARCRPPIHRFRDAESQFELAPILWAAATAAAELAAISRASRDQAGLEAAIAFGEELEPIVERLRHAHVNLQPPADIASWTASAVAELARIGGADDSPTWATAAAAAEGLGNRLLATISRLHQAEAILRDRGSGDDATAALRAAAVHAKAMGATALMDRVRALARAGRIRLDDGDAGISQPARSPAPDPWGLSEREREVLALVADGRTNRQIGDALFISDKTASVHVTHILNKMGVSSRTEAALVAARAGAITDTGDGRLV